MIEPCAVQHDDTRQVPTNKVNLGRNRCFGDRRAHGGDGKLQSAALRHSLDRLILKSLHANGDLDQDTRDARRDKGRRVDTVPTFLQLTGFTASRETRQIYLSACLHLLSIDI